MVFEAGGSSGGVMWTAAGIIPELGPDVFTCAFDRPGIVYDTVVPTAPVPMVLSPHAIATILVKTLEQADVGPRVILVGHSIGGMNAVEFGAAYPDRVAGAVCWIRRVPRL